MEGADPDGDERFVVVFEAYEGPIDALRDLARSQRVDLGAIDLVSLVAQFEAVLGRALALRIEVAADWLVAAAWLAYLKSRSLVRRPKAAAEDGEPDEDALPVVPALKPHDVCSVDGAIASLGSLLEGRDWTDLVALVPRGGSALRSRSNLASHLVAALELARTGRADVAQERPEAAVMVREARRGGA